MKQTLTLKSKGQLYNNSCRLQYSLSIMDRTSRQKISKEIEDLNKTVNQQDIIDIYRPCHSLIAENTFFSSINRALSRIGHIFDHKQI